MSNGQLAMRLAMIWRRVGSLQKAQSYSRLNGLGWRTIGQDAYSVLYDAGKILVGFWVQDEQAIAADDSCSGINLVKYVLVANYASQIVVAPARFPAAVKTASRRLRAAPVLTRIPPGEVFEFFDDDGNLSSFLRLGRTTGAIGRKIRSVSAGARGGAPVVAHRFLVSNVARSVGFYSRTLGLNVLEAKRDWASLDVGTVILSVQAQPAAGLVESLRRTNRLLGDLLILHVSDVAGAVRTLSSRGVTFPHGIERSGIGQTAYFQDPDGHSLAVWQPSGAPTPLQPINFYPALQRILS